MKFAFRGPAHQLRAVKTLPIAESGSFNEASVHNVMEYKLPKTVIKKLGLESPRVVVTDESFKFCVQDGEIALNVDIFHEPDGHYASNTFNTLPSASIDCAQTTIYSKDTVPLAVIGVMKSDIVVAMVAYNDKFVSQFQLSDCVTWKPNGLFITTPKVYLETLRELEKFDYAVGSLDSLDAYLAVQADFRLASVQAVEQSLTLESEVELG